MNKLQLKQAIIERIEKERTRARWTQQDMAGKLGMSLPGYRKMVSGLTDSLSFYTVYRAAEIFQIPISTLYDSCLDSDILQQKIYRAPESVKEKIHFYLEYEEENRKNYRKATVREQAFDVMRVTGYLKDGMLFDSYVVQKMLIKDIYGVHAHRGFQITENTFLPAYEKGDILLLNEEVARNGDVTLIMDMKNKKFYIRQYIISNSYELHPINGRGSIIVINQEERKDWRDFGHVITSIHPEAACYL